MIKKRMNKVIGAVMVFMLVLGIGTTIFASIVVNSGDKFLFSEFLIYGDQNRVMASGYVCANPYNKVSVRVDNMYKVNGDESSYKKSIWSFSNADTGLIVKENFTVTKGELMTVTLTESQVPRVKYVVNVRGNNVENDALISGRIGNFNME